MNGSLWGHSADSGYIEGQDLIGYAVEATDGRIGKVDRHSVDVDAAYLVVDTGPWIFGKQVLLPAGTVERIDHDEKVVHVNRSKDEIKGAPEFADEHGAPDSSQFGLFGGYYGPIV